MVFVDLIFPENSKELVLFNVMMYEMNYDDGLEINEIMLYVMCMCMSWRMNMGCYLWYFLVWESKSRTVAEERWDTESFVSAEDDEWIWSAGDFLFLFEDILPGIDYAWE